MVDDERDFALTLAERLELRGFTPSVAFDGESALERVRGEHFDLVLLDVMLPGLSGLTVLRRIREMQPGLPVVLLTGNAGAKDGAEGIQQGARACINKPLDLQELLSLFAEIAKESRHA
ncbi:MAG: response regulator [Deltaproteobacteria bacterium]|jgi:DNA-binding response OmpR family regulator|nr:response regulator [Deltaproteobacteria bacterium]